jgi:opacity protein-like surface antigen
MSIRSAATAAAVLGLLALGPAVARAQEEGPDEGRKFGFRLQGGGFTPARHLDEANNVKFDSGWNVGAGLSYNFTPYVALRGNVNLARAEIQDDRPSSSIPASAFNLTGAKFNRYFYDADLQFRYPFDSGVAPYVFVGGGAVTVDHSIDTNGDGATAIDQNLGLGGGSKDRFTKGAGKAGVGLSYRARNSGFEVFLQGTGWVYKWDRAGFDRTQVDVVWDGGFGYRF